MNLTYLHTVDVPLAKDLMLMDHWRRETAADFEEALQRIRRAHPEANAVRILHDFHAWQRNPKAYVQRLEERLCACDKKGFQVIPCLFNRWHDRLMDIGGIYLEQLIPDLSWAYQEGFYQRFLEDVLLPYDGDRRIPLWDLCNKPLGVYPTSAGEDPLMARFYELRWLREMYCFIKKCEVTQPVGISCREDYDKETLERLARCCDVFIRSPYCLRDDKTQSVMHFTPEGRPVMDVLPPEGI